jgi:uroporphyrinogen decarboxylase
MRDIEINMSLHELKQREKRVKAAYHLERVRPTPALPCFLPRYWLALLGVPHGRYFQSADLMLRTQLLAKKWILENVKSDFHDLTLYPDMCHHDEAWALGCDVGWEDDHQPWIHTHPINDERSLQNLSRIDVADNRAMDFIRQRRAEMLSLAEGYRLCLADGAAINAAELISMPGGTTGIFTLATDLRGPEIYLDIKLRPAFVKELLAIVTDKVIERLEHIRNAYGLPYEGTFICDDSAAILSPDDYREFLLPFNLRYKEHFGGICTVHCDGRANHLLPIYRDELGVGCFWSFGYQTDRKKTADHLGGKVVLVGNINPMTIFNGTPQAVFKETMQALQVFAPWGGYIIMDGSNIPPGSPLENINAMSEAALAYERGIGDEARQICSHHQ